MQLEVCRAYGANKMKIEQILPQQSLSLGTDGCPAWINDTSGAVLRHAVVMGCMTFWVAVSYTLFAM